MATMDEKVNGHSKEALRRERDEELQTAARALRSELTEVLASLKRSWLIERQAIGLAIFDSAFRVGMALLASAAALVLSAAGTLLLVSAARRWMDAATDAAWWGDLVLGIAITSALALGAYAVRRRVHRKAFERTQAALEPCDSMPEPEPEAGL